MGDTGIDSFERKLAIAATNQERGFTGALASH